MRGGKKNVYLLGASSLFNDMGSEMITPILPFFIQSLGGGGLSIGLISGLREGLSSLLKLFGGWLSDKRGKRIGIVFFGYIMSAILKVFIGLSQTSNQIISFVSLERIGKLRDAPRDAIIAKLKKKSGEDFGIHEMFDKLGGVLGTILVLILFWTLNLGFRTIAIIAAGISIFSILPLIMVKDKETNKIKTNMFQSIIKLDRKLKKIIILLSLFAFINFGLYMFFLIRVERITGSMTLPLVFYAIFNLVIAIFSRRIGMRVDKIGKKRIIFGGYILFSLICLTFIYVQNIWLIALLFALYGVVMAMTGPVQRTLIAEHAGEEKGTAMGMYYCGIGIMTVLGGIFSGYVWDLNPNAMYYFLFAASLILSGIFYKYAR